MGGAKQSAGAPKREEENGESSVPSQQALGAAPPSHQNFRAPPQMVGNEADPALRANRQAPELDVVDKASDCVVRNTSSRALQWTLGRAPPPPPPLHHAQSSFGGEALPPHLRLGRSSSLVEAAPAHSPFADEQQ